MLGSAGRWFTGGCVAVAASAFSGCGAGADREQARAAASRFSAAFARQDGRTACAQLSPALRKQLIADEAKPTCQTALARLADPGGRVLRVQVYATSARADLEGGQVLFLGDTREGWRIEAVGCKPQGPGPYDCEEQA